MFNKLNFNNLVITNKKHIQQARAQTIAKLVQKLRKLKDALGKSPENEKHKERIRKNVECISQLKTFKCVQVMSNLLLLDANKHKTILTNGRATPDEIALALLGLNKKMQEIIKNFQEKLNLSSDPNAAWRSEILETSKRRQKLERTEQKKRKRQELKDQKALTRNRLDWLEHNKPDGEDPAKDTMDTVAGVVEIIKTETETAQKIISTEKTKTSKGKANKKQKSAKPSKPEAKGQQKRTEPEAEIKSNVEKTLIKMPIKSDRTVAKIGVYKKPDFKEIKRKISESEPEIKKTKKIIKERPTHVIDPFFITETGQPYLSTAVGQSDDSENETADKPVERKPKFDNRQDMRSNNKQHPSWLAKQKQKPIITHFKGQKIKFSEDASAAASSVPVPAIVPTTPVVDSAAGMHPSWVAKQKLKPKIATFTGTKIKFDDD